MNDPMRPPTASASGEPATAPTPGGLQGVLISPRRSVALIDGTVVPLGTTVRGATLSGVSDSIVVLRKNGERDVLLMYPNIDKKPPRQREAP